MDSNPNMTYRPDRRRQWRLCLVTLCVGGVALTMAVNGHHHAAAYGETRWLYPVLVVMGILFIPVGLLQLQAIIRGVPRLSLNKDGLTFGSMYRTSSIKWADLGVFTRNFRKGTPDFRLTSATARILRPTRDRRWGRNSIEIPNAFEVPLEAILDDIARRNSTPYQNNL
jgi:hypothetical protein